mmetsp:Transcript_61122/g.114285  ORF Transcript_61122/g.114285 Transcript_61122/m.114285 type:complete len:346 (-) Transcript_61122:24-1061(-)
MVPLFLFTCTYLGAGFRPDRFQVESLNVKLELAERSSIAKVSFVPSGEEIQELLDQSRLAEKDRAAGRRGPLLSKLFQLPGKFGLCPDSLNPDDTILAKLGRGSANGGIGPGGSIGDASILTFINDRNMPLGSSSNGPNAVLTNCSDGKYGSPDHPRINLFYESEEKVMQLLGDFMSLRRENEAELFKMYVSKLQEHDEGGKSAFKLDPTKPELLSEALRPHYTNTVRMLQKVAEAVGEHGSISDYGLEVNSYCQTWLRNGGGKGGTVGTAQFSVMSPHFQTRFFVASSEKLEAAKVTVAEKESYMALLQHFDHLMADSGYAGADGPAFVNLDGLHHALDSTHSR